MVGRWDTLQRGLSHPSFHRAVKADIDLLRVVCTTREQALLSQGPSSGPPPPSRVHYRCATPLRSAHSFHYRPISIFFVFFFCLCTPDGQYRSIVIDHAEKEERWKYFRRVNVPARSPSEHQGPLQGIGCP